MSANNNNTPSGSPNHNDPETQHEDVSSQMNVAFVEEQPLVSDDARLGNSLSRLPPTLESQMPDEHWMAAQQLSKPIVIGNFKWTDSDLQGTTLQTFVFPEVLAAYDSIHLETLNMYTFFKMNWHIKLQINGTKFHSGQLICSWDPFLQSLESNTAVYRRFNRIYATGLPNVCLNASSNEPVEICIPFVHPRSFLTTNSLAYDTLGAFRITVLNALRLATGSSSSLSVTAWLYASDASVHVPIYRHSYAPVTIEPSMDMLEGLLGKDAMSLGKNIGSTFGNLATGNFGGAAASGGKSLTGVAKMLGLDYPSRPIINQSHINSVGPMSPGKGVDSSYRLALDPRGGHVASPDETGSTREECDIEFIKTIPMLMTTVKWTDARQNGDILFYYPVTPNICVSDNDRTESYNTYLSWFSNIFSFWRGALEYRFDWVSTQFHTGRVLIAFIPNAFTGTPTLQQAYSCPSAVVDLQESSSCTVTVPFVSPTLWKSTSISNGTYKSIAPNDENIVGWIYVYVLNPLVRPSNVSDTIEFNISIAGGSDLEFAVPKANELYDVAIQTIEPSGKIDRLATRTSGAKEKSSISVAFGSPMIPHRDIFGEKFPLLDFIKRYSRIDQFDLVPLKTYQCRPLRGIPDPSFSRTVMSPLYAIQQLFACWSGSLRYKFVTNANRNASASITATHVPYSSDLTGAVDGSGLALQRTNLAQNNALEVEVPFYVPYNFVLASQFNQTKAGYAPQTSGTLQLSSQVDGDNPVIVDVYQAAGDDYRPFYLIPPPNDIWRGFKAGEAPTTYFVPHYGIQTSN